MIQLHRQQPRLSKLPNSSKIGYNQVFNDGNNFWLKLEEIGVYVYSNYTTEWYYFSMVNNSKEIFNSNPINNTNTYNVVDILIILYYIVCGMIQHHTMCHHELKNTQRIYIYSGNKYLS